MSAFVIRWVSYANKCQPIPWDWHLLVVVCCLFVNKIWHLNISYKILTVFDSGPVFLSFFIAFWRSRGINSSHRSTTGINFTC